MIRKAIIVQLTLLSFMMGGVMVWSIFCPSMDYYNKRGWIIRYSTGIDLHSGPVPSFSLHLHNCSASLEYWHPSSKTNIPIWFLALVFATYPTIAFIRGPLRRYRRRRNGLCIQCGYNLTGNTTGICSECGAER